MSFICDSYLMVISTSNKSVFVFHISFCVNFCPQRLAITHTHSSQLCFQASFDHSFSFIINSIDGESEVLHGKNKSVDINPSFSAASRVTFPLTSAQHSSVCLAKLQINARKVVKAENSLFPQFDRQTKVIELTANKECRNLYVHLTESGIVHWFLSGPYLERC